MTDEPPVDDAALDKVEQTLARLARRQRGVIVLQIATLCVLMLFDLGLIWLEGGRQAPRDTAIVLGLAIAGLGVCATRVTDWQYLRTRDAREISLLRLWGITMGRLVIERRAYAEREAAAENRPPSVH